jgi:hypothetical protein
MATSHDAMYKKKSGAINASQLITLAGDDTTGDCFAGYIELAWGIGSARVCAQVECTISGGNQVLTALGSPPADLSLSSENDHMCVVLASGSLYIFNKHAVQYNYSFFSRVSRVSTL